MLDLGHEFRLLLTIALNAGVFAGAHRFARRQGAGGPLQAACDAFLLYIVLQYVSVALPGMLGIFNLWTMSLIAVAAAGLFWFGAGRYQFSTLSKRWSWDHFGFAACATFVIAYIAVHIYDHRVNPPLATDPLVPSGLLGPVVVEFAEEVRVKW